MLRIYGIRVQQVVCDFRGRFPEHIGDNPIQGEVAHSESVLVTVLFTGTHGNEFVPIAGQFPENPDLFSGDVAAGHETHSEQVSDPSGIFLVILVALDSRNPFGVRDDNMEGIFKNIPDRNSVLSGAFHTDLPAVVVQEPLPEIKQASVGSAKVFLFALGDQMIPGKNCGDEEFLVDIDATADGNDFTHNSDPPFQLGREAVTVPPHIKLRQSKQFLVCGLDHLTDLCLKGGTYTDCYTAFAPGELHATPPTVLCSVPLSRKL